MHTTDSYPIFKRIITIRWKAKLWKNNDNKINSYQAQIDKKWGHQREEHIAKANENSLKTTKSILLKH